MDLLCTANWIFATDELKLTANRFWSFFNMENVTQNDDGLVASVENSRCQQLKMFSDVYI